MAYEKQTWATGDVITAEKMNHIEDGIEEAGSTGGGCIVINKSRLILPAADTGFQSSIVFVSENALAPSEYGRGLHECYIYDFSSFMENPTHILFTTGEQYSSDLLHIADIVYPEVISFAEGYYVEGVEEDDYPTVLYLGENAPILQITYVDGGYSFVINLFLPDTKFIGVCLEQ